MSGLFLIHRDKRWLDSWTYGDWRQWICEREEGSLQCARTVTGPLFGWALMLAVGPRQYDGRRILPGEPRS